MQAVLIRETGDREVLTMEEVDRPEPAEGEVLIRVRATSVNPVDWKYRRARAEGTLPMVLGREVSGSVELSRADDFAAGDEVFAGVPRGAYAEFAVASADATARKPAGISHEQAAALPVAGMTAWEALFDHGGLQRGQTALIAGAAGGVGHLAIQLAKVAGARVIGTGSTRNRDFVLGLGADQYVDYTREAVGEVVRGVDLAIDTVGGQTTQSLIPAVRDGGVVVTIAGTPPEDERVRGDALTVNPRSDELARIAELVASGEVRVEIAETLPLSQIRQAHELSESGHTRGKIVLTVQSEA